MRWEMEWKAERAHAVGLGLVRARSGTLSEIYRRRVSHRRGFPRLYTRADDPKDRYYAPLLDWWKVLTDGMQRAKLEIAKAVKKIEDVKQWAEKSLSPMLGLLCAHPEAGERWLVNTIIEGVERWRAKHLALLAPGQDSEQVKRKMRWWNPRDGFSAAYANTAVLRLYMCGPRLRGRCRSCGTVFVFLWSHIRQGWYRWDGRED